MSDDLHFEININLISLVSILDILKLNTGTKYPRGPPEFSEEVYLTSKLKLLLRATKHMSWPMDFLWKPLSTSVSLSTHNP